MSQLPSKSSQSFQVSKVHQSIPSQYKRLQPGQLKWRKKFPFNATNGVIPEKQATETVQARKISQDFNFIVGQVKDIEQVLGDY